MAPPSQLFTYFNARQLNGDWVTPDAGVRPRVALRSAAGFGLCPADVWPDDDSKVNVLPSEAAYKSAKGSRGWLRGYYRIGATGSERQSQIKAALSAGYPCIFGLGFDEALCAWPGGLLYSGPTGPIVGHQMFVAVGYTHKGVEIVAPWGENWCDSGFGYITWALTESDLTDDWWVLDVLPENEAA
jgi:hypothetical protein